MGKRDPGVKVIISGQDKISSVLSTVSARMNHFGKNLTNVGKNISMKIGAPLALAGGLGLKMAGDFEASMIKLQTLTSASQTQFELLRASALELGKTTKFSATQTADAMGVLGQAGFTVNEILSATPGILQLASAGGLELAESADIASSILRGYRMEISQLNKVNDVLAFTANATNSDIRGLGEAFTYAGPVAAGMKIKFEETAGALGLMANAGFKGTLSGTALRGALTSLATPTAEAIKVFNKLGIKKDSIIDSAGNVKSLISVVEQLEKSGASTADIMLIFGERAGPGVQALVSQGSKALAEFSDRVKNSAGEAARVASDKMKGFNSQLSKTRAAFEGIAIAIGDSGVLDDISRFLGFVARLVNRLGELNPTLLKVVTYFGLAAIATGPLLVAIGQISLGLAKLPAIIAGVRIALTALMANPVILAIAGLAAGLYWLSTYIGSKDKGFKAPESQFNPGGANASERLSKLYEGQGIMAGGKAMPTTLELSGQKKYFNNGTVDVNVNIGNAPKGTKVTTEQNGGAEIKDLYLGFAG